MATIARADQLPIRQESDIVIVRQTVRAWSLEAKLSLVDLTKMVTAASEIARNTLSYGGGGVAKLELLQDGARTGIRVTFEDQGPGILDVQQALSDGFTTGGGLGLGLGGARRLVNEFDIISTPGRGTSVMIARWR
ncbi:MAG TPA: anti-sigma regulatory factor [Gemmatimonadaceae bacterium]|nr:anti-sigma regulatory factor [Gemmatimonadaceae bacterium]